MDARTPLEQKSEAAAAFMALHDCCLEQGFSLPLRKLVTCKEDLLPGGCAHHLLQGSMQGVPHNVAVENAFARVKNYQRPGRGRTELSHNIAAKHLLSEAKAAHTQHLELELPVAQLREHDLCVAPLTDQLQAHDESQSCQANGKVQNVLD